MIKRFFILLLAIVASVGMSYALTPLSGDAWDESTKTLTVNANPGKNAYKDNTEIEHVIINNGVTSIGNAAFYGCSSLTSVTLPSGLTTIGNDAFRETSLASVSLPSGLISIGNNAFNQCTSLASVTFPEGLETIGIGAFSGCPSLTSVTLPESLTTVNVGVFSGCTSLASVTILAPSLSTYGQSVFYDTASGLKIYVPAASVDTYKAGWSTYADKIEAIPGGGGSAPTVTWNSSNVSNLTVNGSSYSKEGVTLAPNANDNYAYWLDYGNESQNGIYFYVNSTGGHTFSNSLGKNFTKIEMTLNGSNGWYVAYLGSGWNIDGMKVIWTGNASTVDLLTETSSFGGAAGVKGIVFYFEGGSEPAPANVCGDGLTWELSEGVLTISYDGEGTGEMTDFGYEYDENPVNVAPWKENKSEITTVIVGDGVKSIGNHAFNDLYENFTAVTIANSVERIGVSAFMNAKWVTEITLPSSLKTIDRECFAANFGITSITIPSGVTSIGYHAFGYCTGLTSLTCEATTPPTLASGVFYKIRSSTSSISSIPLYVPSESVDAYEAAAQWNAFDINGYDPAPVEPIPCTPADLGKVLCTDGSIYATVSEATAASKTAAAVIAYVDTQNGKALALALADDGGTMEWGPAKTTAPAHTPAVSGGTWKLASKDDWNNMITAAGGYEALRDGFSAVGGTNMQQDAYWSSTPVDDLAWIFYFAYGGKWVDDHVDNPCYVRACLEFDIPAAPAYETVMNLINEIPNPAVLTAECKAKIDAARTAYDALSAADKDLVTNIATLTTAEAAFENVMNIWLSGDCDAILWNDTTLTIRKHAGEGNGAMADYNYMSRAPWYNSHWHEPQPGDILIKSVTIEEGVTHLGDYAFAWMSEMKTLTIPSSVTTIPEYAFYWSKAVDDIYLHTNPSDLMWVLPTSADNQFKPEKGTLCHVPVDLLPAYQGWLNGLNVTYVGDQTPTVLTLEVGRIFNDSDEVYIGPDTTYIQFNCFASDKYLYGKGTFKIIGDEFVPGEVFGIKFEPKSMSYCFMNNAKGSAAYGTNCCATAKPTKMTVVSGDGTKANPFIIEPDTKGECVQAEWTSLPQAVSEITYDGQPHTLITAGVSTAGTVQYSLNNGANWSAELPQGTDPVTYTIHYRVIGGNACIQGIDYDPNNKVTASIVAPAVEDVEAKIAAIPQPVVYTPACNDAIAEARSAYDALDDELKPFVENDDVLTAAEATYNNMKYVSAVEAKINNIPTPVTLTLATRDSIQNARAAYDALTADQQALVPAAEYQKLLDAEAALAEKNPGGGMPAGALSGKFTINADGDQIAFAKGNLQATTTDLGANWTWGFAANQWNCLMIVVANSKINGNGTVSENGTVDLFGWSTAATYYGINNSDKFVDYPGDFVDWGPNMGAGWRTLTKDEWNYLIENNTKGRATVNDKNGYIFLPNDWSGPAFTPDPNNFTTNVYSGDDWTAMENAGAVFLPCGPARNRNSALVANDVKYYSSTSLNNDSSYVFTIYYNQSQSACTVTSRAYGCMVRLVTEGSVTPLDSAQAVKDLIDAIPVQVSLEDACVNAIQAARDAYNALADATKDALDDATVQKLNKAITDYTALIQAGADKVIAKIALLPNPVQESDLKLSVYQKVQDARAAYDALNAAQQALVTNYQTLLDAEAAFDAIGGGGGLPTGALTGAFSVGTSSAICFSQGNLQATTADLGANWTWSFAEHQWDFIGNAVANTAINDNKSVSTNGTVDLFGWSTSATYYGISNNPGGAYYTGDFIDWGTNAISNGGNTANAWHTLAHDEWDYLFNTRTTTSGIRYAKATVNGIPGIILLPDDWNATYYALSNTNDYEVDYNSNDITTSDWTNSLEANGAVFLPAAGERLGADVSAVGSNGHYWSSTFKTEYNAYCVSFNSYDMDAADYINRREGYSVRLVVAAPVNHIAEAQAALDLINAIPSPVTLDSKDAIEAARAAVDALDPAALSLIDDADMAKLTDAEQALMDLNQAEADKVIAKINNIPLPVELKLATRDSIESARAAYDALTADQQALVPAAEYQKLLDAEAALAALNPGGSIPMDIVWDGNTGIASVNPATTSPAYEGMTVTVGQGSSFSTYQNRLYFTFYSQPNGGYIFANENGTNITKVVIESTTALTSTMTEVDRMGSGWVISNENTTATWTGNADSVSIWQGQSFTNYWVVDTITFTVNGVGATPLDSAQAVKDLIDAIPVPVTLNDSDAIQAARAGYDALADLTKGALDNATVKKLTDAEDAYAALIKEATDVIALINAIPQPVVYNEACGVAITAARNAYDALSDELKPLVTNNHVLTDAETAYSTLKDGVDDAIAKIDAIPSPVEYTDACKDAIDAARNAYDALNNDQKAAISTAELQKLTDAEAAYAAQKKAAEDQAAADAVVNKINAIGEVEYSNICKNNIEAARAAYDALTDDQKARVTAAQLQVLTDAEAAYAALAAQYEHNVTYLDNDDATLQTEMVALVNFPEAPEVNGFEFVRWDIVPSNLLEQGVIIQGVYASLITLNPVAYDTLVYNGAAQTLIVAGQSKVGHLEYRIGEGAWSATLPQAKDAGAYDVIYKLVQDGKPDYIAPDTIKLSIAKTPLVVTADDKEVIFGDEAPANSVSYTGFFGTDDASVLTGNVAYACNYIVGSSVGEYAITPSGTLDALNYTISYAAGKLTVKPAPLTITAENKSVIYGDAAPQFTVVYSGWKVQDSESVLLTPVQYTTAYVIGSSVGVYDITPHSATAQNYDITFVNGTLTVNKAVVYVSGAVAQEAKFADGHAIAVVLNQGTLNGIKLNDPLTHVTTATFSSADVAEHLTITLFYELQGSDALLANYDLQPTSEVFSTDGVIIEPFLPNDDHQPEEGEQVEVKEGIDVYAYGYCDGNGYYLKYHLNSGYPDQYKIDFADSRFTNVAYGDYTISGRDGTIAIDIPMDMPTGDYTMTVTFRDSRFPWLESNPFNVTFHVNLPETYVTPLFGNVIALVDTCNCFTDIQWYHRDNSTDLWQPIPGATGHYYHVDGKLAGEYFVQAKMDGVPTYTCGQADMETLYGADKQNAPKLRAYPNPVVNTTQVVIENADSFEHNMRIVNMMGVELLNTQFQGHEKTVDMSGYVQGNYMISVDGIVVKVVKQ